MKVCSTTVLIAALALPFSARAQANPTSPHLDDGSQSQRVRRAERSDRSGHARHRADADRSPHEMTRAQRSNVVTYCWTDRRSRFPAAREVALGRHDAGRNGARHSGQTVTTKETRQLSADGSEMLVETMLIVQHGYPLRGTPNYGAGKDVFVRVVSCWSLVVGPSDARIPFRRDEDRQVGVGVFPAAKLRYALRLSSCFCSFASVRP